MENKLVRTSDGSITVLSGRFNAHYHSMHGAVQESMHIFIRNGLNLLAHIPLLKVMEIGWGTGLNTWLTRQNPGGQQIQYTAYETFPISLNLANSLDYTSLANQPAFMQMHQCAWNKLVNLSPFFSFRKIAEPAEEMKTTGGFHLVYHDAFAPDIQPELWTDQFFSMLFESMAEGGLLLTYCAKGQVKQAMRKAGFTIERLKGPPGKKHIIRATKTTNES